MVFTSKVISRETSGSIKVTMGTYTNTAGSTGGDIDTGLAQCLHLSVENTGNGLVPSPSVDEDFSNGAVSGGAVTIVTNGNASGIWVAYGK